MKKEMLCQPVLLETIRIFNGSFTLLPFHLDRMKKSCRELYGQNPPDPQLSNHDIPSEFRNGTVKCRITYSTEIHRIEFEHYETRRIHTLKTVRDDSIDYHLKYADRTRLDSLRSLKGGADEIIIVRNGLVTDTSFSNILCICGEKFLTPARPLLEGVMRRYLIENGLAMEADITPEMLRPDNKKGIEGIILINSMLPPGTAPAIRLSDVIVTPDCR